MPKLPCDLVVKGLLRWRFSKAVFLKLFKELLVIWTLPSQSDFNLVLPTIPHLQMEPLMETQGVHGDAEAARHRADSNKDKEATGTSFGIWRTGH